MILRGQYTMYYFIIYYFIIYFIIKFKKLAYYISILFLVYIYLVIYLLFTSHSTIQIIICYIFINKTSKLYLC